MAVQPLALRVMTMVGRLILELVLVRRGLARAVVNVVGARIGLVEVWLVGLVDWWSWSKFVWTCSVHNLSSARDRGHEAAELVVIGVGL